MTRKLNTLFATAAVLMGITTATAVFAQEGTPASQSPRMQGMMGGHGGMLGQMSPDQTKQMTGMMDRCNHMMENVSNAPTGPDKEREPATNG